MRREVIFEGYWEFGEGFSGYAAFFAVGPGNLIEANRVM